MEGFSGATTTTPAAAGGAAHGIGADLGPILAEHHGTETFAKRLAEMEDAVDLLRGLAHYVDFNACFGGGVANLAGEIAVRRHLFRDASEPLEALADRSDEVAAAVFLAAIDEFGERASPQRHTHRVLAQATLKAACAFLAPDAKLWPELTRPNRATVDAIRSVCRGYCLDRAVDDAGLLHAIGFHMGSEVLADREFRVLDAFLRSRHPELVAHLEGTMVCVGGVARPAYLWVKLHTVVEAEHFAAAVVAANTALRHYSGPESLARAKGWILDGFASFARVQQEFMEGFAGAPTRVPGGER